MKKITTILTIALFAISCNSDTPPYDETPGDKPPGEITPNRIYRVFDFRPAPGQFVNVVPEYESGDTQEDMNRKAEEQIRGNTRGMISLGGFGGFVVFGFERAVVNVAGVKDFAIWGNAMMGSSEPGIVLVMHDANGNGLPDDEWFELAGSEFHNPETIHNYKITYFRPPNDTANIRWTNNQGETGYIFRTRAQPHFPQWVTADSLVFRGSRLPNNAEDRGGTGTNFFLRAFDWGYADNHPNTDPRSGFNIEWAVDREGHSVHLPAIHFVKVFTAINQTAGWIGETSTEIMGAEDLHPEIIYQRTR